MAEKYRSGADRELVFRDNDPLGVSSEEFVRTGNEPVLAVETELETAELSPIEKELSAVSLPELPKENRARLQMQSPTRLYFYWSFKDSPYARLQRIFGGAAENYTLAVKLTDRTTGREDIYPIVPEGSRWFDVDAGSEYRADVGFYAPNRPFVRILHSNTVSTPRKSPSPRPASEAAWTVTADRFAQVLDVSGFGRDAFDVAIAGDDEAAGARSARAAFDRFIGRDVDLRGFSPEDLRYVLLAIASGLSLEDIRPRISRSLYNVLLANLTADGEERAAAALEEEFGVETSDVEDDEASQPVYGSSLINFPRRLKKRLKDVSGYRPVGSPGGSL